MPLEQKSGWQFRRYSRRVISFSYTLFLHQTRFLAFSQMGKIEEAAIIGKKTFYTLTSFLWAKMFLLLLLCYIALVHCYRGSHGLLHPARPKNLQSNEQIALWSRSTSLLSKMLSIGLTLPNKYKITSPPTRVLLFGKSLSPNFYYFEYLVSGCTISLLCF